MIALAAALEQKREYKQIYLARPIVPLSNKDIGYLPGDIKSKLNPYMEPLWDNLKFIQNQYNESDKEFSRITEMIQNEKLVITGSSMGGQVVRYALAYMEKHNMNHNTRLYISQDSPHLGANIPLGVQDFLDYNATILHNADARESMDRKLDNPAAREMLLQHHLNSNKANPLRAAYHWLLR